MKNIYPALLVIQLLWLTGCFVEPIQELPAPTGLLCELLRKPEKAVITDSIPEFGWIFPAEGKVQTYYRILVASSPGLLEEGKADLWDSGFVPSSGSINVPYRGKPLEPGVTCHWKVRVRGSGTAFSPWSKAQQFHTGRFSGRDPDWPGESRYRQLDDGRWVSENRQTAAFETLEPVQFVKTPAGHWFADFGKAAFGTLEIDLQVTAESAFLEVCLGERSNPDGTVNKEPGLSNIGFRKIEATLPEGDHTWRVELPPHESRYPHSQRLAPFYPEVMPFRYVEIGGLPGQCEIEGVRQLALFYPFDDEASFFRSDNHNLNQVWELCKYTLKATPFLGVYADGNRERMPYEADAYIQQLGHYAVDREFSIARYSADFLIYHASWPTEWLMHTLFMAWEDYMNTGNLEFIERVYDDLKAKTLLALARDDGLISTRTGRADRDFLNTIHYSGNQFRDITDWPAGTPEGEKQANNAGPTPEGERDGFVFTDYNTVINAFHYRGLVLMGGMADALGNSQDRVFFRERARQVRQSFLQAFLDRDRGIFRDGEGTGHASLHANMFPLAFGLVPGEHLGTVLTFIKSRGMACSVYGAQYLLDGLYRAGEAEYALELMTSEEVRSWMNMIRAGSSMTTEAWDEYYKPNLTWNHAWGSAPANIIARKVMGIEPLEPGFGRFMICPRPGYLDTLVIRKPCIRGSIEVELRQDPEGWQMKVAIPGNSEAEVWIPGRFSTILVNGKKVKPGSKSRFAGEERKVFELGSGTYVITAGHGNASAR